MIKQTLWVFSIAGLMMTCNSSVSPDDLYGKWNYIKIEHTANGELDMDSVELRKEAASIVFAKNNEYEINWGGKILSHGNFTPDGKNIRVKEVLPDGKTREFPFWVSELSDKKIVFETLGKEGLKVTAVR